VYDDRYDIKVRANDSEILSEDDFKKIYITTKNGGMVRLDNVVSFVQELTVLSITRTSLQYGAEFGGNTEMDLGTVSDILQKEVKKLTGNFSIEFRGEVKELKKTIASVTLVFFLSILLLYMVLASQFNSFVQPIYIMISEPFAIYGGLLFLFLFDKTLNMFSMISFVLLIGLVAKNAILLIDLTNKNREQGMSIERALIQACPVRLRPILMTSLTVIITMIPTAFSTGSGSNMNAPLAVGIVGGMISSTILTLFIIPVVYSLIENLISKKGRVKNEF
jgi:HAE1 family hydrophobic/amphiphilic exporter-1